MLYGNRRGFLNHPPPAGIIELVQEAITGKKIGTGSFAHMTLILADF